MKGWVDLELPSCFEAGLFGSGIEQYSIWECTRQIPASNNITPASCLSLCLTEKQTFLKGTFMLN